MHHADFPNWLHTLAILSLLLGAVCALIVLVDIARHPQKMTIMNWVWPLTALFGSVIWLALYFRFGRMKAEDTAEREDDTPFWVSVTKGASHCGAGCTLGDIIAEWAAFALPQIAVWLGWHSLFAEKIFAVWILDYIVAFILGVAFQYFTIKPMRDLTRREGIRQAVKADFASITSWQVGMYGLMAIAQFVWFKPAYGAVAHVASPEFWFAMQVAMLAGFCTAWPTNYWLIESGVKERM
ncbi:DUF4396 domain-containing protein [Altericroceibacterium spongiae]|uniref:DUF4396 domain-containing protein n=1 Tax=Altericroceibacterium spongiae TaxID=2320269 RepID=A0A420EF37_9SPHN|nr:DUF4396 domain-containing protein [Altericroceibacterium spongiae]RKF19283.1 DUF4396 domain-containing protein [Altericroceibacterium spongiae]